MFRGCMVSAKGRQVSSAGVEGGQGASYGGKSHRNKVHGKLRRDSRGEESKVGFVSLSFCLYTGQKHGVCSAALESSCVGKNVCNAPPPRDNGGCL